MKWLKDLLDENINSYKELWVSFIAQFTTRKGHSTTIALLSEIPPK